MPKCLTTCILKQKTYPSSTACALSKYAEGQCTVDGQVRNFNAEETCLKFLLHCPLFLASSSYYNFGIFPLKKLTVIKCVRTSTKIVQMSEQSKAPKDPFL